jgi:hypothetical protein
MSIQSNNAYAYAYAYAYVDCSRNSVVVVYPLDIEYICTSTA